jgi:multisubunit Na+/H+ antiporter MnhB subunit
MRAIGIGLIILLIAFAVSMYPSYVNYRFVTNPPNYQNSEEVKARTEELKLATLIGFITGILAIIGIMIFLIEFRKHEHPHEHEASAPRMVPPPP